MLGFTKGTARLQRVMHHFSAMLDELDRAITENNEAIENKNKLIEIKESEIAQLETESNLLMDDNDLAERVKKNIQELLE